MSSIWRGLCSLSSSRAAKLDSSQVSSQLEHLPVELLLHISDLLPTSALVALACCNKNLFSKFGDVACKQLRHPTQKLERMRFLDLLALMDDNSIHCFRCARLHNMTFCNDKHKNIPYLLHTSKRECYSNDMASNCGKILRPYFWFEHVQVIMKWQRLGHQTKVESSLYGLKRMYRDLLTERFVQTFEARIHKGEMFVRAQDWLLVPRDEKPTLPRYFENTFSEDVLSSDFAAVCVHYKDRFRSSIAEAMTARLKCALEHAVEGDCTCGNCGGVRQCHYCPTDVQVDVLAVSQSNSVLVVSKWMNLGSGTSPLEFGWSSHLGLGHSQYDGDAVRSYHASLDSFDIKDGRLIQRTKDGGELGRNPYQLGGILDAFEGTSDSTFQPELTPDLQRLLKLRRKWWSFSSKP